MKANCERRGGNYNERNLRKKEEISGKVTECEKIVLCPVFGLWSRICIFRGEQIKQNYKERV